jgi:hypothetical protein
MLWILNYVRDPPLPLPAPLPPRRRSVRSYAHEQYDNAATTAATGDEFADTGPGAAWDLAQLDMQHTLQCALEFGRIYLPKDFAGHPQIHDY